MKKTLRSILFITVGFPYWGKPGGIGQYTYNLATKMADDNIAVYVIACSKEISGRRKRAYNKDGIQVVAYPYISFPIAGEFINRFLLYIRILKIVLTKRIQLIEAPSYLGWVWPFKLCVPMIVRLHSSSTIDAIISAKGTLPRKVRFEISILNRADKLISVCEYVKGEFLKTLSESKKDDIDVIYNGIDTKLFSPHKTEPTKPNVLFAGNISIQKGALDLLQAWKIVIQNFSEAHLTFIGSNYSNEVNEFIQYNKDVIKGSVEVKAPIPNFELVNYYNESWIVVIPSHFEANPLVVLEAMSCGCAVVCPDHTGFAEIVKNKYNGILCNTANPEELAAHMLTLLNDSKLMESLGSNARQTILERFDSTSIYKENLDLYKSLIGQ